MRFKLPRPLVKPRFLAGVPSNSIAVVALLAAVNLLVWCAVAIVLHFHPALISAAALSYSLGLRHALDADHISAIDLMTRRLVSLGQRPATVGTFFSLGHSTIVVVTCVVVAATSGALRERFDGFTRIGNIIGTAISATVLIILCVANAFILYTLVKRLRGELARRQVDPEADGDGPSAEADATADTALNDDPFKMQGVGVMARTFRFLFKAVDRPWKMYPLGVVFGLGFDTSSEVAILGISSLQALKGTSIWLILIFPVLFTSGMCLIDTLDGASMLALYTSKAFSRDMIALLYYQIVLSAITVVVSAFIGIVQVLSLVQNIAEPEGPVWDGVSAIGDHFDIIGGSICGVFLLVGIVSMILYRPWRRRMDRRHQRLAAAAEEDMDHDSEGPASPLGQPEVPQPAGTVNK
ncbi:high affinity nickel transport protein nic1 [Moelleriella libera RCEF 2490]|uniref:Nickel/cobalt efflux system n=1 Tax=Moelleriella libera RCEF 2490 TaxID=1081109 RepID=A0A167YVF1_9HYPO|nr:high affinity nickel transport protein nic1 [Moelleriella libera RCEF 2490]